MIDLLNSVIFLYNKMRYMCRYLFGEALTVASRRTHA